MGINWSNVSDDTKKFLEERPDLAPKIIEVAAALQAKWKQNR